MMSERYPVAWRDACLALLQMRKRELHSSIGYKKMSWEPICKEILASLSEFWGRPSFYDDKRISRQNIDSWEKGKELKDDKFALIDLYVRYLALSGKDGRALELVREWRFQQAASVLSSLYMRSNGTKTLPDGVMQEAPWTLSSGEVDGTWFRSIVLRASNSIAGVTNVIVAYLPVRLERLDESHFADVVFFEGFLFPLEIIDGMSHDGEPIKETICALKLVRPEFRGLSGIGYAEGELHIKISNLPALTREQSKRYVLEFPSPAICPTVSEEWNDKAISVNFNKLIKGGFPQSTVRKLKSTSISLNASLRKSKIIDKLFDLSYRGYVQ